MRRYPARYTLVQQRRLMDPALVSGGADTLARKIEDKRDEKVILHENQFPLRI